MNIWEVDKLFLFIILTLPGFISLKVYDMVIAGDKRDFSKSLLEIVTYSVLNFVVLSWLIILISTTGYAKEHAVTYWFSLLFIFIVCPALWPVLFLRLSKFNLFKRYFLSPINQPWDKVFREKDARWVIVYLKGGGSVRGKYSLNSRASSYPKERQIYIEELWKKGASGGFEKKIDRSKGAILFESEIKYIEFFGN